MTGDLDLAISDYAASALLRYFRRGTRVPVGSARIDTERDRDILRGHWAFSAPVRSLVGYLIVHRHETHALLTVRPRIDDTIARGRINARATLLHRMQTGAPTAIVAHEPVRTFDTGPNHVLAWVVHHAALFAARLQALQTAESAYAGLARDVTDKLNQVRRMDALRDALRRPAVQQRPSAGAIRDAARSRRTLYRLAVDAYNAFIGIEEGDDQAIRLIVNSTLVGPIESWRRFEIAVALAFGEVLEEHLQERLVLGLLAGDPSQPVLRCGPYALYWQQTTDLYHAALLEPSEASVRDILSTYGIGTGSDRPDLLLVDSVKKAAIAVVEVKYLAADTATARFREAIEQIVRYARGYADGDGLSALLGRSVVAMSVEAPKPVTPNADVPYSVDFAAILNGELRSWIHRLSV